jgi:hypothetical protein
MQRDGWILLDVRLAKNHAYEHIQGSVSIPLYRPVLGRSLFDNAKRLAMASFFVEATGVSYIERCATGTCGTLSAEHSE